MTTASCDVREWAALPNANTMPTSAINPIHAHSSGAPTANRRRK
jgi:hypothetical protein